MDLTGLPLLLGCALATTLAVGLTIIGWRRGGRARIATRIASILLCEVIALFTIGVASSELAARPRPRITPTGGGHRAPLP